MKNIIISVLSLVSFCVTPLFAQESCYEQYLREHNKKILTAEDADDSTYVADVHVALVDSTWYMWLSVDPLADKYPSNSPYVYCNGNPIMLIDPDGRDAILITFPNYKATYKGYKIPHTGHSGVLLINNKILLLR